MTRALQGHVLQETQFSFPFRMILAGSSGSGKTFFAGKLLADRSLFRGCPLSIVYYYPCYLREPPVNWHSTLDIPVSYHVGLPTKEDLVQLPEQSCVVIDDSYDEAIQSSAIDHLFRVISGKRNISVIIMTQNNFSKGKHGRDIRNSCNYSVLFRNCCDASINENVARMAGLRKAYQAAAVDQNGVKYPYMFLDQSQQGQLSPFRLYTDIFDEYKIAWSVDGMKGYVIGASDFESVFKVISDNSKFTAKQYDHPRKITKTDKTHTEIAKTNKYSKKRKEIYLSSESDSDGPANPTFYKNKPEQRYTINYSGTESDTTSAECGRNNSSSNSEPPTPHNSPRRQRTSSRDQYNSKRARTVVFED